ncbi:hypothetical protein LTR85_011979 [Meristemomyces frigidus]|nr:hypothetical protein LTR85_011979 [Meristemomyces frigidus]
MPLQDTVAHLIFVHGLGGGSRKTWIKNADPSLFWPKEWLPHDTDFRDVRIHTFGYDSTWTKNSVLDVGDFAKSLLEWIVDCPEVGLETGKPLILVCHSMGGLVAKQAYVLSRQLQQYERVGALLRSIFFLATPHRGADLAETLSRILSISPGARPFVGDLHPNSEAIQSINENFPRYSDHLRLHSFYETQPMQLGLKKSLVVKKESAILGYRNERATYLDADHRNVCKFDSPNSSNYRAVRNALAASVNLLRAAVGLDKGTSWPEQQQILNTALGVQDPPEDDYLRAESLKIRGSCEWITRRDAFQRWCREGPPHVYWVTAKPGAGKSILCGHVLTTLRAFEFKCSFFFFTHGDKLKSSLSAFFRSMAWQLASTNGELRKHMASVCARDSSLQAADHRTIWRKLFTECVFKHPSDCPQYWVIDALDECKMDHDLVPYLMQAAGSGHIRVFLTSRTSFGSYGITKNNQSEVHIDAISEETTNADIQLFLLENTEYLPTRDRTYTAKMLLAKSDGCFLWTKLALEELRQGLTRSGIQRILDEVPSGMDNIYNRIIQSVFERAREQTMIVAILDWTTCAIRSLTTEELHHALRLDMNDEIDGDIRRFVEANCGQLVVVDTNDRVRMVHLTAREFLFSDKNTTHRFVRAEGHRRLAMACLRYLTGPEMTGARPRKLSAHQTYTERGTFVSYAATALFEHIAFVHSEDDDFAAELRRFLKSTNVLSWIEHIARHSDLGRLVQAGLALRRYTARRAQKTLPFGNASKDNALFEKWATDMVRLVTKFGSHLEASPSSIGNLIAPFCPLESAIKAQFANSNRSIKVSGLTSTTWDDCASTIVLSETPTTVASTPGMFAIGLQNGDVLVYDEKVCQEIRTLNHGEVVKGLLFGTLEPVMIAAGLKKISVWSTNTWTQQWSSKLENQFISLALTDNDKLLVATCRSNEIHLWETDTGVQQPPLSWLDEDLEEHASLFRRPATTAIAADQNLLAIAYRGEDITVWNIEQMSVHDILGKGEGSLGPTTTPRKGVSTPRSMIFSKARDEAKFLVVGYNDGVMNLFNTEQGSLKASTSANAHTLASSNDGLTLACGDSGGIIQLFEFETLKLLYRIQADQTTVKQLAFSSDDQRLLGVQSRHCYVWDPPVLVRQEPDEENSDTISVSTAPQDFDSRDAVSSVNITSITSTEPGRVTFCGKDDGSVCLYNTTLGKQESELFSHATNVPIVEVAFDTVSSVLVTVDVSSRVMAHSLDADAAKGFTLGTCLLDRRIGTAVTQVLLDHGAQRILISTEHQDLLLPLHTRNRSQELEASDEIEKLSPPSRRHRRWCTHPCHLDQLILVAADTAQLYTWSALAPLTPSTGIRLSGMPGASLSTVSLQPCFDNTYLALTFSESFRPYSRREILFYPTASLRPDVADLDPDSFFHPLAAQVHALIGNTSTSTMHGQRLVFLHRNGWVCSVPNVSSFDLDHYDQHYPLPADWMSSVTRLRIEVSAKDGTLLFVRRGELISVRRGLEYTEGGRSRAFAKRPSLYASSLSEESIMEEVKKEDYLGKADSRRLAERYKMAPIPRSVPY